MQHLQRFAKAFLKFVKSWIFVAFLVGLLTGFLITWLAMRSRTEQVTIDTKDYAVLHVASEPSGVTIKGEPYCQEQTTPFGCRLNGEFETTLTAPSQVELEGTIYKFKSWDGCSESNPDQTICKVSSSPDISKSLKANYEKDEEVNSATNTSTPNASQQSGQQQQAVQCTGGVDLGDQCLYSLDASNVIPSTWNIKGDQVTPFDLLLDGAPFAVECLDPTACTISGPDKWAWAYVDVEKATTVNVIANKHYSYTTNDGITRKWRFKQIVHSSVSGTDLVSVQYDFVSLSGN